ncbi:hypothetical protein SCLCIDRAFT_1213988 [Scleroderma citrinum Foug A]|uniref:Uncharacterized protein n=1 Tax=Scleroderma citrinum Foug A TaxID=1036808 RepID=A0A0C3D4D8_9AGAM|nr:hypothetical protein SCLCIDRAFT_1221029 [Scleroderma citrinum Foug A]KIM63565.1 hypothetical protein SCLCIDRAFT_1213988 [Scleroderma citrinum Foug A]
MYLFPLVLLGAYFAWRFYGGAYGALSVNSRKTAIGVMTPVAIILLYLAVTIFQASYLAALI